MRYMMKVLMFWEGGEVGKGGIGFERGDLLVMKERTKKRGGRQVKREKGGKKQQWV